eukprot:TRINITY_DN17326_c0_g1_i1.p1 TRINITY_DN17326_c0_g1~~TRINITY_DN17326_c0_g1_i1.p1  ORF type:complete len:122 (+),score=21.74 TRINITY_DN17326_c0_g1_i1:69-434(+)
MLSRSRGLGGRRLTKEEKRADKKLRKEMRRRGEDVPAPRGSKGKKSQKIKSKRNDLNEKRFGASGRPEVSAFAPRPIPASNVGNLMLRKLGWSGGGLGVRGDGIAEPIAVVLKNNKRGLGL